MEKAFIDAQILPAAVLLKDFDFIPGVMEVTREMDLFAKVNHVYSHSALVHGGPQHGGVLDGKKSFNVLISHLMCVMMQMFTFVALIKDNMCRNSGPR